MKVLIIGNRVPWPLHDGGAIATYYMLKGLAENGIKLTYLTLNPLKHFVDEKTIETHFPFCEIITHKTDTTVTPFGALKNLITGGSYHMERFTVKAFSTKIKETLSKGNFDLVHVENLFSSGYAKEIKSTTKIPMVLRQHNVESAIWEKMAAHSGNLLVRTYLSIQAKRLKKFEQKVLPLFDAVVPIATTDEVVFKTWCPKVLMETIPAGINVPSASSSAGNSKKIFHIGSMEWLPNKQGVEWFLQKVWPLVREKDPSITFHFAGKRLDKLWNHNPEKGIFNHGEVANANDFMNENGAMIVPLLSGSGIRIKTLEAMSTSKPVISTTTGAAGLDVEHNINILLSDTPEKFAENAIKSTDIETYKRLSESAKQHVEKKFDYLITSKQFIELYNKLLHIK